MTIICIKSRVVAADSSISRNDICMPVGFNKLARSQDGAVGAATGLLAYAAAFRNWFEITSGPSDRQNRVQVFAGAEQYDIHALWLERDGSIWHIGAAGIPYCAGEKFISSGVSEDFALGAMAAGLSAEKAVLLTIEYSDGTRGPVRVERVEPLLVETKAPEPIEKIEPVGTEADRYMAEADHLGDLQAWRERQGL